MTEPLVRSTLTQVRDGIAVPPPDRLGVRARAGRLRRRRRGMQALGAGAAAAALAGSFLLPALRTEPGVQLATPAPSTRVPVVLGGQVQLLAEDGSLEPTGRAGTVVGVVGDEVVTWDDGVLLGATADPVGDVSAAFASPTGVTYQSGDGTIHVPDGAAVPGAGTLVAAGDDAYVTQLDDTLTVHGTAGDVRLATSSDGARAVPSSVQAGGATVVVAATGTVSFYAPDGERLGGFLGGTTGALSPDGTTYAYAPSADERRAGMRPGLVRYDVRSGRAPRIALDGDLVDLRWVGDELLAVVRRDDARVLLRCDEATCADVLTDPGATLALR